MAADSDSSRPGRRRDTLLVLAVPVLLCAVAAVQLHLVEHRALSRWKGGGFGMFSTVDSPSARFLRIYLQSDSGEVPVLVPKDLRKTSQKVRVMPTEGRLAELTEALRGGTWVHLSMVSAAQHYEDLLRAAGGEYRESADDIRFHVRDDFGRVDFAEMRLVRMLGEDEEPRDEEPLRVTGARVEVWRYVFDREEMVLRAHKITEYGSPRDGE